MNIRTSNGKAQIKLNKVEITPLKRAQQVCLSLGSLAGDTQAAEMAVSLGAILSKYDQESGHEFVIGKRQEELVDTVDDAI